MALHTGVATSKVMILVGAGLTGSVVLSSGRLSDIIGQLQEVIKGVNEAETSPGQYDIAVLTSQLRHLAQEIRELSSSKPITIFNGESSSSGNLSSYLMPAAAVGAVGYCYMWWKGFSFSDVMFVTKQNMASAVANVSQQLDQVSAALSSAKRHLSQRLENLDGKLDEQKEITKLVMNEVVEVKSNLYQIGFDVDSIQKMVSGLEGKLDLLESKQDITNSGLWYLCQYAAGGTKKNEKNDKLLQDMTAKYTPERPTTLIADTTRKGLQFIADATKLGNEDKSEKSSTVPENRFTKRNFMHSTRIHRSYPMA
ncbi:hypothetical protein ACHQM5_002675 [Ranunculus cassubicifolius]